MQRLIFEFQRTCDNNLSFETFRHKIENHKKTAERQIMTLDSLLGLENTKKVQEKKKRDEMKQKKEEMEKKKKEEEEKLKRKEERAKKKKEEEQKKKEEENNKNNPSTATTSATTPALPATTTATPAITSNDNVRQPQSSIEAKQNLLTPNNNKQITDDLLRESNSTNKDLKNKDDSKIDNSMISNTSNTNNPNEKKDFFDIEKEDKLDISENNLSALNNNQDDEETKKKKKSKEDDSKSEKKDDTNDDSKSKEEKEKLEKQKKEEQNIGEAIMSNDHYEIFKKFNKIAGGDLITIPETFLPDQQMKIQRQKAMNNLLDIDNESLDYLSTELSNVRTTFEHFKKLVDTIKRLDNKVEIIEKNNNDYLAINEDDILEYIKDYLISNQIAEQFIVSIEFVRQTPFFEDFFEKIVKYMETLTQMLKKRFYAFAKIEENSLVINYSYLKQTMTKFSTLNLAAILNEIYTDLNSQILKFMLNETVLLFESQEEDGQIKKYLRIDDSDEDIKINEFSTPDNIREYMDILQNNAEKYFNVLIQISKIITSTPLEIKLEELQDYLENKMETLMKNHPEHYQKQPVLDILKKFDDSMNKLSEVFVFDMKGMAENIETTKLEETLKKRLLSLKNQMYTQMKALKDCSDKEDYNFFQEIILEHFLHINKETQKVVEKKKGNQNKRSCLEVIVMNYQLLSSLIEVFEQETDHKSIQHYNCLVSTVKAVKEYFSSFIDLDAVQADQIILQKALHTYTDIQFLECTLSDAEAKYT